MQNYKNQTEMSIPCFGTPMADIDHTVAGKRLSTFSENYEFAATMRDLTNDPIRKGGRL